VTEQVQWENDLVFKIGGKMFATVVLEPSRYFMSLKCSPEAFAELVERPGIAPAPYLARANWVALESVDALPRSELESLLRDAYAIVLAKLPEKAQADLRKPAKKSSKPTKKKSPKRAKP
jgi:predicted DNA-binding protein (MmcQ/YjbR family)